VIDEIYDGPIAKSSLGPSTKKYDLAKNRDDDGPIAKYSGLIQKFQLTRLTKKHDLAKN
jgi:hypothetical protein